MIWQKLTAPENGYPQLEHLKTVEEVFKTYLIYENSFSFKLEKMLLNIDNQWEYDLFNIFDVKPDKTNVIINLIGALFWNFSQE